MTWTSGAVVERLPNGLTLVAQRDPAAPAVAVVTHVRAGFFDEPDEWQGISHVLEHMFFKGTARRGVGRIAQETKALGGYLNASTSYDRTLYYAVLPARNLAAALDIQSDALRAPALDPAELAKELRVIIEEAKRKLDSPGAVAGETLHELLYDQHRIRRWRIGYEAQLAGFTALDLRAYYASRYVPERVVVALVGDLDPAVMLAAARPCYADWSVPPSPIAPGPLERSTPEVRARTLRGDVAQVDLVLGWRGVPALHPDEGALDLASAVLGTGRGSWLHRALREPGIAASAGAYSYAPDETGVFGVAASGAPTRLDAMIDGLATEVDRLRSSGPSADDVERARTLLKVRWVRRMENFDARATALAWAVAHGDVTLLDREYAHLLDLTREELRSAAERHLTPAGVSGIAYLPATASEELTAERVRSAFARPAATPLAATPPVPAPPVAPRIVLPAATAEVAGVRHFRFPGADLLIRRKEGIPTTTLAVHFLREWEGAGEAGLGALAARSAVRGAGALDAAALALAFERLGGSLAPSASSDGLALGATVLSERLAEAAALMQLVLAEARFADVDVQAERSVLVEEAREAADDMFRYPFQVAFREAFGASGYGVPVGGTEESLMALTAAQAAACWRGITATRATIVAVSDLDPGMLAERLAAAFAGLVEGTRLEVPGAGALGRWSGAGVPNVTTRAKQQTAFAMLFPGPARRDPAFTAAEVWGAVASGLGGRLFESLREKRSLAYTVLGSAWGRRRGGALAAYIATSPAREEEARTEMLGELHRFATTPPSDEELSRAKQYLAGQAEVSRMTAASVAAEIVEAWLAGEGLEELRAPWERYAGVTADDVMRVAAAGFDPVRRAEGVVRGSV
ncbi:MAG TPA: pitrilysin family protein [Gemmatimonadales bacterium]|nr:pitrilysin family protein [Gemmatimonadales bacterium]